MNEFVCVEGELSICLRDGQKTVLSDTVASKPCCWEERFLHDLYSPLNLVDLLGQGSPTPGP